MYYLESGIVFVYTRTGNTALWSMQRQLISTDGNSIKTFGWSVAIHGASNQLMVGAPCMTAAFSKPGYVLVYSLSSSDRTVITYQATLQAPSQSNDDLFGYSIALGADAAFIGFFSSGETITFVPSCFRFLTRI